MIGDDNFLNVAAFDLNYEISYRQLNRRRIRHCGDCISGLKIAQATELIRGMDDSVKNVLINVGSVDVAEGRQLIEMTHDLMDLLYTCDEVGIHPILTTLPPLPNYLLGNKKIVLNDFNNILRTHVSPQYAVIDLNLCMVQHNGNADLNAFQPEPRMVGGSNKPFVLWNKLGRQRIFKMIIKNLGHALYNANYLGEYF